MIPGLDGLRAIAFLIIFGLHTGYLQFGWMGVQLFFVLSGYLITLILLRMKESLPMRGYLYKFYIRRFLRIFPLYYFYLFLMLGIAIWLGSISFRPGLMQAYREQVLYAFLYVYDFYSALRGIEPSNFLVHLWSLSVEEQFYLIWPILIFITPEKSLKKLFLAGIIAGPAFRLLFHFLYHSGLSEFFHEPVASTLYPLPFTYVDAFAFGAYISCYSIRNTRGQFLYLGGFILFAGFASQYLATGNAGTLSSLGYPATLPNAFQYLWAYSLLNYWFALLIYCVVNENLFVRFLEMPPIKYLGRISYGLYVYHIPIIWTLERLRVVRGFSELSPLENKLAALAGTVVIASISYFLLERPLIRLKDNVAAYSSTHQKST